MMTRSKDGIRRHKAKDGTITYGVRIYVKGERKWIGSFPLLGAAHGDPETEARAARHQALTAKPTREMTVREYVKRYLAEYEGRHKDSSTDTARSSLKRFLADFGYRQVRSITRLEAKEWVAKVPPSRVPIVVTLLNQAVEDELIERNPFRGLGKRTKGRRGQDPPTPEEFEQLRQACSVMGNYGPMMRAMLDFAGYTAMRPGEMFALEWSDVDLDRRRIKIVRGLYRGKLSTPKSGEARLIALTPQARDAIIGLPHFGPHVFTSKTGKRMSQVTLSNYWSQVKAKAGLDFPFYLATRHYCAHYMLVQLGLPRAVVKEQMGHADDKLLDLYGHEEVGALERIDAAFAGATVTKLRAVGEEGA